MDKGTKKVRDSKKKKKEQSKKRECRAPTGWQEIRMDRGTKKVRDRTLAGEDYTTGTVQILVQKTLKVYLCFAHDLKNLKIALFLRAEIQNAISHPFLNGFP